MDKKKEVNPKGGKNEDITSNTIDQYIIEEKLGEGMFGTVKLGTHKITKEKVAIKFLNKNRISKAQQVLLDRELSIVEKMHHFNIAKLYSIIETENITYLIQEYSSGKELSYYVENHPKVDEKEVCKFFQQMISGIEYIHKMGVAHRDLKPENILLTRGYDIKIIDFGLSNKYDEGQLMKTSCGSPYYAPPEMLQGKKYNGLYSDIYSCGIILYYLLCKTLPFNEKNNVELYKKKIQGKFSIPKSVSKDAQDLLRKIIRVNPNERIKLSEIKKHPWFNLVNTKFNLFSGLDCKEVIFPVDEDIVQEMADLGFNKAEVRCNVIKNQHNNITTTYYLLLDKKVKKGRKSIADLHSNLFEDYINNPENKISNYPGGINEAIMKRIDSKKTLTEIPNFSSIVWEEKEEKKDSKIPEEKDKVKEVEKVEEKKEIFEEKEIPILEKKPIIKNEDLKVQNVTKRKASAEKRITNLKIRKELLKSAKKGENKSMEKKPNNKKQKGKPKVVEEKKSEKNEKKAKSPDKKNTTFDNKTTRESNNKNTKKKNEVKKGPKKELNNQNNDLKSKLEMIRTSVQNDKDKILNEIKERNHIIEELREKINTYRKETRAINQVKFDRNLTKENSHKKLKMKLNLTAPNNNNKFSKTTRKKVRKDVPSFKTEKNIKSAIQKDLDKTSKTAQNKTELSDKKIKHKKNNSSNKHKINLNKIEKKEHQGKDEAKKKINFGKK